MLGGGWLNSAHSKAACLMSSWLVCGSIFYSRCHWEHTDHVSLGISHHLNTWGPVNIRDILKTNFKWCFPIVFCSGFFFLSHNLISKPFTDYSESYDSNTRLPWKEKCQIFSTVIVMTDTLVNVYFGKQGCEIALQLQLINWLVPLWYNFWYFVLFAQLLEYC